MSETKNLTRTFHFLVLHKVFFSEVYGFCWFILFEIMKIATVVYKLGQKIDSWSETMFSNGP